MLIPDCPINHEIRPHLQRTVLTAVHIAKEFRIVKPDLLACHLLRSRLRIWTSNEAVSVSMRLPKRIDTISTYLTSTQRQQSLMKMLLYKYVLTRDWHSYTLPVSQRKGKECIEIPDNARRIERQPIAQYCAPQDTEVLEHHTSPLSRGYQWRLSRRISSIIHKQRLTDCQRLVDPFKSVHISQFVFDTFNKSRGERPWLNISSLISGGTSRMPLSFPAFLEVCTAPSFRVLGFFVGGGICCMD